jgi:hypothetical protein
VIESGADGVGLFRTEFIFLGSGDMPSEDEQFEAYRKAVKGMEGRPITIRTFDLGNDKQMVSSDDWPRSVGATTRRSACARFACRWPNRKAFQAQLRAILRVSKLRQGEDPGADALARFPGRPDPGRRGAGQIESARSRRFPSTKTSRSASADLINSLRALNKYG